MKAVFRITQTDHKPSQTEPGHFFDWYQLDRRRLGRWKYAASGTREEVISKMMILIKPPEFFSARGEPI